MERKLASIQKIADIQSIEGADKIEYAKILNWWCVIKKGTFSIGELVLFCEIDSVLPRKPWNEFLFKDDKQEYRLRSVKLRGKISQGLIVSLKEIDVINIIDAKEGDDLTEKLNITKYEPVIPAQLRGKIKGNFPSFLRKTDEIRIQSEPEIFTELKESGIPVYASVKLDGSSMTCFKHENNLGVCCRKSELAKDDNNSFWKIVAKYNLEDKLPDGYAIQGELCGEKIQGNKLGLKGIDCFIFNVFDIQNQKYLNYEDFKQFVLNIGMKHVRIVYEGNLSTFEDIDSMLKFAEIIDYDNGSPAEGLVWRPMIETYSKTLRSRLSFKTISNKFLLKYGE